MLVIKIEMWPGGVEARASEIGRMHIFNDGTGDKELGNYGVRVMRRGTRDRVQRTGRVENYAREAYPVWHLVRLAIEAAGYDGAGHRQGDAPEVAP